MYRPRRPRDSPLWRLLDRHYDEFEGVYDERYQHRALPIARAVCAPVPHRQFVFTFRLDRRLPSELARLAWQTALEVHRVALDRPDMAPGEAEPYYAEAISLPMYPGLTEAQKDQLVAALRLATTNPTDRTTPGRSLP